MRVLIHLICEWVSRKGNWNGIRDVLRVINLSGRGCIFLLVGLKLKPVTSDNIRNRDTDHRVIDSTFCGQCDRNLWILEGSCLWGVYCDPCVGDVYWVVPCACLGRNVVVEVTL